MKTGSTSGSVIVVDESGLSHYGKDMVLDNEQAKQLADYAVKKEVYNWDGVEWIVTEALAHGNKVVINADW